MPSPPAGPSRNAARALLACWIAVTVVLMLPIWLAPLPPLTDLPNHLARVHILLSWTSTDFFQRHFLLNSVFVPNLGFEMIVKPLSPLLGLFPAAKVYLSLSLALLALACWMLSRPDDGAQPWFALAALPSFYNSALLWGFLNYMTSVAGFVVVFSLWLRWKKNLRFWRWLLLAALLIGVYAFHIFGVALFGLAITASFVYDAVRARALRRWPRFLASCALLLPEALIYLSVHRAARTSETHAMDWAPWAAKAAHLASPFVNYNAPLDAAWVFLLAAAAVYCWRTHALTVNWRLATIAAAFVLAAVAAPARALGAGVINIRLMVPAAILALCALSLRHTPKLGRVVLAAAVVLIIGRTAALYAAWSDIDRLLDEQVASLEQIQPRSRVAIVKFPPPDGRLEKRERILMNGLALASVNREAFVAHTFGFPSQDTIIHKRTDQLKIESAAQFDGVDWPRWADRYDYLWCWRLDAGRAAKLAALGYAPVYREGNIMILKYVKTPAPAAPSDAAGGL